MRVHEARIDDLVYTINDSRGRGESFNIRSYLGDIAIRHG